MEAFLKSNPGLNSRFDKTLKFDDYSPEELTDIAVKMLNDKCLILNKDAEEYLIKYLRFIHEFRDKYFGNARIVRTVVDSLIQKQNIRLADLVSSNDKLKSKVLLNADPNRIALEDLQHLKMDKSDFVFNKSSIGFKKK